jgi:hypothetical protein
VVHGDDCAKERGFAFVDADAIEEGTVELDLGDGAADRRATRSRVPKSSIAILTPMASSRSRLH